MSTLGLPEETRAQQVDMILWGLTTRLRTRGWQISVREVQRAQDLVVYLTARFGRPPTDVELERFLRPVFCGRGSDTAVFAQTFRASLPAVGGQPEGDGPTPRRGRQRWARARVLLAVGAASSVFVVALLSWPNGSRPAPRPSEPSTSWVSRPWFGAGVVATLVVISILAALMLRGRLRRGTGAPTAANDLELQWHGEHPLPEETSQRIARMLRRRAREPSTVLDVARTVEASLRAGRRLEPRYVEQRRTPEYLVLVEQRSAGDVLAEHHGRVVGQLRTHGVAVRWFGVEPRSQLVVDPVHGRRPLDTLQPVSDREQVLLVMTDNALRDPLSGRPRAWLSRLDRWARTTQIAADAAPERPLPGIDLVLPELSRLDPVATQAGGSSLTAAVVTPAALGDDEEAWLEPLPPAGQDVARLLDLLATSLGPDGWYWLSACALYPEITYDMTVALGRLLTGETGTPLADTIDVERLAVLPWFRHARMPDWLRSTLLVTMTHGQLVDTRAAVERILVGGLLDSRPDEARYAGTSRTGATARLRIAGRSHSGGRRDPAPAEGTATIDQVYFDAFALRRSQLSARAPRQLVTAMRRRRDRAAPSAHPDEAPALRVRRMLTWCNALVLLASVGSTILIVGQSAVAVSSGADDAFDMLIQEWAGLTPSVLSGAVYACWLGSFLPATITLVYSALCNRRHGVMIGAASLLWTLQFLQITGQVGGLGSTATLLLIVVTRLVTLVAIITAARRPSSHAPATWPVFARRNARAFVLAVVVLAVAGAIAAATAIAESSSGGYAAQYAEVTPMPGDAVEIAIDPTPNEVVVEEWIAGVEIVLGFTVIASLTTVLTALYCGGVYLTVLAPAGTVLALSAVSLDVAETRVALALAIPGAAVIGACFWWIRRHDDHPPPEAWETRWHSWRWPLMIVGLLASWGIAWLLPGLGLGVAATVTGGVAIQVVTSVVRRLRWGRYLGPLVAFRHD